MTTDTSGIAGFQNRVVKRGGKLLSQTMAQLVDDSDPVGSRSVTLRNRVDGTLMSVKQEEVPYYTDPFIKPLRIGGFNGQATEQRVKSTESLYEVYNPNKLNKPLGATPVPAPAEERPFRSKRKRKRGKRG